jgi:integrative and conjugative element protein (TIGR02256 family)
MTAVFHDSRSGGIIELTSSVVELLVSFRQTRWREVERGGLLFANPDHFDRVVVDVASPPHPNDLATRNSLALNHDRCMAEIRRANKAGRWLVGYWHTHLEKHPRISPVDRASFDHNLRAGGHQLSALLAVLVGTARGTLGLAAYMIRDDSDCALTFQPTETLGVCR